MMGRSVRGDPEALRPAWPRSCRRRRGDRPHVRDRDEPPALGLLAAAGPRAAEAPAEYTPAVRGDPRGLPAPLRRAPPARRRRPRPEPAGRRLPLRPRPRAPRRPRRPRGGPRAGRPDQPLRAAARARSRTARRRPCGSRRPSRSAREPTEATKSTSRRCASGDPDAAERCSQTAPGRGRAGGHRRLRWRARPTR